VNKGKNFPSFLKLSAVRHADSSTKFVRSSRQETCQLPWSTEPWNQSTK
jgi:hypothetical protein